MPNTTPIPLVFLQELKIALDDALLLADPARSKDDFNPIEAFGRVVRARAEIEKMLAENIVPHNGNCDMLQRQQGFNILKQLDNVKRMVRKDYGLEDAAV